MIPQEISTDIIGPLAQYIFNLPFTSGIVPDSLKSAKDIPVFKRVIELKQETI